MRKKIVRFGLVGVFNTLLNLVIFNLLLFGFKFSLTWANLLSLIISISISFVLNAKFVFKGQHDPQKRLRTYLIFFASSLFSQILVQQLVITIFAKHVTAPGHLAHSIALNIPVLRKFSERFYVVNVAKVLAVLASLSINFLMYEKIVFKHKQVPADA